MRTRAISPLSVTGSRVSVPRIVIFVKISFFIKNIRLKYVFMNRRGLVTFILGSIIGGNNCPSPHSLGFFWVSKSNLFIENKIYFHSEKSQALCGLPPGHTFIFPPVILPGSYTCDLTKPRRFIKTYHDISLIFLFFHKKRIFTSKTILRGRL